MSDPSRGNGPSLQRQIGLWTAVTIVVGSTIGSGIFASPGVVANRLPGAGPILLAWATGGLFALTGALTIAELSSALPRTGGIYVFLREAYGRIPAYLFSWAQVTVIRAASLGAIATVFAKYTFEVLGIDPDAPGNVMPVRWLAAGAIAVTATFNYVGVRWGGTVSVLTTAAKYFGLLFIVAVALILGLPQTGGENFANFIPAGSISFSTFGLALVGVLWAYDGWADLSYTAGEVREPQRNLPRALIFGTIAIVLIYLAANIGYLAVLPIDELRGTEQVAADVARILIGAGGVAFVGVLVMISTFGTLNNTLLTAPRIFYAAADDGLLPGVIARVHPRFHTPAFAIVLCAALGIAFVLSRTFTQLADLYVIAFLPFYGMGVAAIFVLRKRPDYNPSFRAPLFPLVPITFLTSVVTLLVTSVIDPAARWATVVIFAVVLAGLLLYPLTTRKAAGRSQ